MKQKGLFITLEGPDGGGKTTQPNSWPAGSGCTAGKR